MPVSPFINNSDSRDRYEYVPLPTYSANRHITHVLRLLPDSDFSALVRCELQEVSLDEKPVYKAISYCWRAPLEFHPILCHDKRLNVSPSLTAALRHLQRPETSRALWADAICISQNDILEHSQQVQMKRNIFEGAEHVLVWLGQGRCGEPAGYEAGGGSRASLRRIAPSIQCRSHNSERALSAWIVCRASPRKVSILLIKNYCGALGFKECGLFKS
jgi:hypothetical protein